MSMLGRSMLNSLFKFINSAKVESGAEKLKEQPETLVAAILIEAAVIDGQFSERERVVIESLLKNRFDLDLAEINALIDNSKEIAANSVDLYGITKKVNNFFGHQERVELIEMLWEVIQSDGVVQDFEASIMRRLSGLLHVSDKESGEAKKRSLKRAEGYKEKGM